MRRAMSGAAVAFLAAGLLAAGAPGAQATAPQNVDKTETSSGPYSPSDTVEFTVSFQGSSGGPTTYEIRDNIDARFTNVNVTSSSPATGGTISCTVDDSEGAQGPQPPTTPVDPAHTDVTCTGDDLNDGETVTVVIEGTIESGTENETLTNAVTVETPGGTGSDTASITVEGPQVTKTVDTSDPFGDAPEDTVEYTIDIGESDPSVAAIGEFELRDNADARLTNINVTSEQADVGSTIACTVIDSEGDQGPQPPTTPVADGEQDVECTGNLEDDDTAQVTIEGTLESDVSSGESIDNAVTFDSLGAGQDSAVASFTTTAPAPQCEGEEITITGTGGDDVIDGTNGDDVIHAGPGDDLVRAHGGNDVVCGGGGADVLNGGDDNDKLVGAPGDDTLRGQAGGDVAVGGPGNDTLVGAAGNDTLRGQGGADELRAHGGNDTLVGGTGNDEAFGGVGNDELRGQGDDDTLRGNPGDDNLIGAAGGDQLLGAEGNDTLRGSGGPDAFNGGPDVDDCVDFKPAEDVGQVNCE